jgi:hypothetical protein
MTTRFNLLLLVALSAPAAYSSTAIVSFTNNQIAGHGNYDLAGFQFSTSTSIDVTSLGMYVSGASLADTHDIGVYDLAGDLEFFGTVDAGATPDGSGFTYVNVGDNFLTAGNYFIGVLYNQGSPDEMYSGSGSITMAPGLAFLNAQVYFSGSPINFSDPAGSASIFTQGLPRDSYIGPNFTFNVVPEPGTLGMFAIGAAALALRRRK